MEQVTNLPKFDLVFDKPFFKDVLIKTSLNYQDIEDALYEKGILGPLDLSKYDTSKEGCLLFSATEKRTKEEIDTLVSVLEVL
jgi:glycine dehydrogenase subunit 1